MEAVTSSFRPLPPASPRVKGRWWKLLLATLLLLSLLFFAAAEYILHHAGPLLRKRIVATLSARFDAPVTLDSLDISLFRGIEVSGDGLHIGYCNGTAPRSPAQPMSAVRLIAVRHFAFRTGLRALVGDTLAHRPLHIANVRVEGLDLHIPPRRDRNDLEPARTREPEKYVVVVDQFQCRNVRLFIESGGRDAGPGSDNGQKPPLEFDMGTLDLQHVGRHQAMLYDAQLINVKPVGAIHAVGHFGPWANETTDNEPAGDPNHQPGNTPLDGDYTFDHADLGTVKGIGGTLSSTGHFAGTLDRIAIDGHTDTPNFSLGLANHPLPLHTDFHAIVDGTDGDTYLQPIHALLGNSLGGSAFTVTGKVVKIKGQGHDIQLNVDIPHGRMGDFLRLAVKTSPPLMNGILALHATLHIPPGHIPVPEKMSMAGAFTLTNVQFNNLRWQNQIDGFSARAQGRPELAKAASSDHQAEARSLLAANFTLNHGVMGITGMHYAVPGAQVLMNGVYSTDGKLFEFKGHVRTDATASAMVGGWRGLLLSPFDHFLQKNGAGLELPVEISGTAGDIHLGLALKGVDDKPAQLLADVRGKAQARQDLSQGRNYLAEAAAEDGAAAHAPTLEEAQRHHNNAVHLRAQAQHLAQQAIH